MTIRSIRVTPEVNQVGIRFNPHGDPALNVNQLTATIRCDNPRVTLTRNQIECQVNRSVMVSVIRNTQLELVTLAVRGLPGPSGGGGGSFTQTVEAGETISALKPVVVIDGLAFVADSTDDTHKGFLTGVSITSATIGNNVTIQTFGVVEDAIWNWDESIGAVYVGVGVLTQTPPLTGWLQSVGRVQTPDKIFVDTQLLIERL